jgi:hypothetical protein
LTSSRQVMRSAACRGMRCSGTPRPRSGKAIRRRPVFARRRIGYDRLPGRTPQPDPIDVGVLDEHGGLRVAFELKVTEIGQTLWDMVNIAAAERLPSVERGYLVVAATARSWAAGRRAGCPYFAGDTGSVRLVPLPELIDAYRADWRYDLRYPARPAYFPELLEITQVARDGCRLAGIRAPAAAVGDAPGGSHIASKEGWPVGMKSC